ncbi:MAG: response regulator [Lachnotalea sp.]
MYKLLIVDDEEIERNGMVNLIPWSNYDIEIVGSAWNGFEGYELIKEKEPDIVLTDIKMPGMNGIELIQKVQKDYKDTYFIVLSGYGEYEFTSQAMELGVKYYILKPCDEDKILKIVNQLKAEILEKNQSKRYENKKYNEEIKKLLPRAREQFFNKVLNGIMVSKKEYLLYKSMDSKENKVRILNCRIDCQTDNLEKFVLQNIAEEVLGMNNVKMTTYIENNVIFLIKEIEITDVITAIKGLKYEYKNFCKKQITVALSDIDDFLNMISLYDQTKEMLIFGQYEKYIDILTADIYHEMGEKNKFLFEYDCFKQVNDYNGILMETNMLFAKFTVEHYDFKNMQNFVAVLLNNLIKYDLKILNEEVILKNSKEELYSYMVESLAKSQQFKSVVYNESIKDNLRINQMLFALYSNINQRNLSLQWLAKEVLYLNEEYLGKLFNKTMKKKFSTYIFEIRIEMAKRLIKFKPEILISELSEIVGYSADGQYFSKAFKKYTTMKPTEYRDLLMKNK